jgi:subtilisin family serine protease/outer membrane protein assembly factor BamB
LDLSPIFPAFLFNLACSPLVAAERAACLRAPTNQLSLSLSARFLMLWWVVLAMVGRAAPLPDPADDRIPFTARELTQGYRDQLILARPHPSRRAAADAEEAREGTRVRERFPRFRDLRIIEVDASESTEDALARLQATGRYEFVEPDYIRQVAAEPTDPLFANGTLWALRNTGISGGVAGADIQAPAAWELLNQAPNVIVAVIDTGVNTNHQDLAGNLWQNPAPTFGDVRGARFIGSVQNGDVLDDNGHGTHVAGTIGAAGNNGVGSTGVAWRVQLMPVKVFPASGYGANSDIVRGVNYAVAHGAHIINASYGETGSSGFTQSSAELAAINGARAAGVIFVAAAGNSALNLDVTRVYPASHGVDNMVTVGATTRRDELALYSNYGSGVDLFAPGSEIVSLSHNSNTGTATKSGTSMAAPHVAGALALLKARFPNDNYRALINRLLRGVDRQARYVGKAQSGGRLNLFRALSTESNLPFNDRFADRPRLAGDNLRLRASNLGATAELGEPAHAGVAPTSSVWWEWSPASSGAVTIDTSGSEQDTVLAVYTNGTASPPASPADLVLVAANDNDPDGVQPTSRLTFAATAGVTYQIAISTGVGTSGLILLNVNTRPGNDQFSGAARVEGVSARTGGYNANCTLESGEPRILGHTGGNSLWYRWTAPRAGRFQVSAISPEFDPVLAVYTGSAVNALTLVTANDNAGVVAGHTGSLCTIQASAGTTYFIKVDSKNAADAGQFTLSLVDSLWQGVTGNNVTGAPAIGNDGTVYVGSTDRSIYAYLPNGVLRWVSPTGGLIDTCSPAIALDGTVYIGSNDGILYAFAATGEPRWTHPFGSSAPVSNSPALATDGTIYVKAGDGYLYALDPSNGAQKWRRNLNAPATYASPVIAPDGTIYQGSEDGNLYALNPDGTIKWTYTGDNDIYTAPAIDGVGNLYFAVLNTGKLFSITSAGQLRWTYAGASLGASSSPALSADGATVYYGGYDQKLHAVQADNGLRRWTYPLGNEVRASSPAVDANGVIYIGCYDAQLHAINPDGTLKRTYATGDWIRSSPAIYGQSLYVGSNDGKVYAFDIGANPSTGPWPQYRNNVRRTGRATVLEPLAIVAAPQPQSIRLGEALTLTVGATGEKPLTYVWRKDGALLSAATGATYTVTQATVTDAGSYTVTIRGAQGSVTSVPVLVSVDASVKGRLINVSVRAGAGSGEQILTIGFVVVGASPKPLLLRGIGPTLTKFGVASPVADPQLQLRSETDVIASNNDWAGASILAETSARVGAFALDPASKDAALTRTVGAGAYYLQVTSESPSSGIALAEVYDTEVTPAIFPPPPPGSRLVNLSARAQVNGGEDILVAGFALSGTVPKQLLIRGIGPALAGYGIAGPLGNPVLELYRDQTKIAENDDWGGGATLAQAFKSVAAFDLTDPASRDAALLVTLEPGTYTAQIKGLNGATGIALIELYEML